MNPDSFPRRHFLGTALPGLGLAALASVGDPLHAAPAQSRPSVVYNIADFGAVGDGLTLNTAAIQAAINACHANGGGLVLFPPGRFLSGTIILRDHVTLHLTAGAVLLGSTNIADYPTQEFPARDLDIGGFSLWALVFADGAKDISIEGSGVIDGNGEPFKKFKVLDPDRPNNPRPRTIFLKNCRRVTLRDLTVRESGMWTVHLALCDEIRLSGLRVISTYNLNQDGIVLDSCQDGVISDCYVRTVDDCIVIKSSFPRASGNLAITNCVLTSYCAALKFGSQSLGGFFNVSVSNCAFHDCRYGGLKFQAVDGGDLENISVTNIVMQNVTAPIFIRLGNRAQDFGFKDAAHPRPVGRLRHVVISGVQATVSTDPALRDGHTMSITGLPGHPVEDVVLENIRITFPGGGTVAEARRTDLPERETAYPEHNMFGVLPAYGLFVRHARGLTLNQVRFETASPDLRPALVCEDAEEVELTHFSARGSGDEPLIRLNQTRGALLQNCRPLGAIEQFVRVEGGQSTDIAALSNDLRKARIPFARAGDCQTEISVAGNLLK